LPFLSYALIEGFVVLLFDGWEESGERPGRGRSHVETG